MHLDLGGHPLHTRALSVVLSRRPDAGLAARGDLVDLRKRGFTPVGSALQGAGIIHQMGLDAIVELPSLRLAQIAARMPVVAFEAGPGTRGEGCRDISGRLAELRGLHLDEGASARLREAIGGPLGCSHVLVLAQLLCATVAHWATRTGGAPLAPSDSAPGDLLRRDLVFDGAEIDAGRMAVGVQLGDLHFTPAPSEASPIERLAAHHELRLAIELNGWPATIAAIDGAERRRTRSDFATAAWQSRADLLAPLRELSLGKGAARELARVLDGHPPLRDAMLMLVPALIQCRASFPDKWLDVAATAPGHPGLIGMPDSCYMWRRGGALEQIRAARGGADER